MNLALPNISSTLKEEIQHYKKCLEDAIIEAHSYNICIPRNTLSQFNHDLLNSFPQLKEHRKLIEQEFKNCKDENDKCTGKGKIIFSKAKCDFEENTGRFHNFPRNVQISVQEVNIEVPGLKGAVKEFCTNDPAKQEILNEFINEIPISITFQHLIEKGVLLGCRMISDEQVFYNDFGDRLNFHPIEAKMFVKNPLSFERCYPAVG